MLQLKKQRESSGFTFLSEVLKVLVSNIFENICVSKSASEKEHHNDEKFGMKAHCKHFSYGF